ncbi:putative bifunctional diguanylate cyclase/phosphodiesterase [Hoeflea sp.]|uniref:putative bifunctional diguanylate cyclase/phosphodiesterase n=1 Tax=Hoeflea sp. TaxID=1940281 RepID=UPI003B51EED9
MTYPLPKNEIDRLAALSKLRILDTEPTAEFDAVVEMAAAIFDAPVALVSFLDQTRQWFKARKGLDVSHTCREVAFCNHTIFENRLFQVKDAARDERFRRNPLVTGEPHIRFYIGVPLSLDGRTNIASLCVIDTVPRRATETQITQLLKLRDVVVSLIRTHRVAVDARTAERNARHRGKLLSQIEKMSKIGAWSLDINKLTTRWSPRTFEIHELEGDSPPSLEGAIAFYPEYERQRLADAVGKCMEDGLAYQIECDFITALGNRRRVRTSGELEQAEDGTKHLIGIIKDITDQHEHERQLWHAAHVDALTGIANRRSFHEEFRRRQAAPAPNSTEMASTSMALLMIDLDDFKEINDGYGHLAGDKVLCTVAERVTNKIPRDAFCARLGGDEFAVLLSTASDVASAEDLAGRLLDEIGRPISHGAQTFSTGASIGIARQGEADTSEDTLFAQSDLALYHVKQNGRGGIKTYEPSITEALEERRQAIARVKSAIAEGRLEPHYQPIVETRTRTMRGVEALARIRNADGTVSGPAGFWQALQEPQCAHEIDRVILDLALRDFARWKQEGLDIGFVSVNASSACIHSDGYFERVMKGLDRHGLTAADLKIEVVESVFLDEDSNDVRTVLERLSAEGIGIALDDFGTGFASLSHLRDYPINCIKIDKSFVTGLGENENNTAIVNALVSLGKSMSLSVVAEGIETEGQLDFIAALGSQYGQGYLFSRPMDATQLAGFAAGCEDAKPAGLPRSRARR